MLAKLASLRLALPMLTTLLVITIGAGVSGVASSLLRRLGDEQAIERVRTAGLAAERELDQVGRDVEVGV
ncbi:MAG TPA: hypothetical protein VD788_01055, partial [Candidatus Polarisedimenticolaceae bacterium]|nr:hypothetical protein [Candidatus Polarisedimenticolaceae bacterium]